MKNTVNRKDDGSRSNNAHYTSGQRPQQVRTAPRSASTAQTGFQLNGNYNEMFPALGESVPSQPSRHNTESKETSYSNAVHQIITDEKNNFDTEHRSQHENRPTQAATLTTTRIPQVPRMNVPALAPTSFYTYTPAIPVQFNTRTQYHVPQSRSAYVEEISRKLSEIIISIHRRREFVSRERVQLELFQHYGVASWSQLGVRSSEFSPLVNLTDRIRKVTFYMQIFEQIYVLCTLHDLGPLLAGFLKLNTYEDALLGPLDENPDVKRVFRYEPTQRHQPIPFLVSGDVITLFIQFRQRFRGRVQYGEFLNELVNFYQLRTQRELGLYCKSFPYLQEVSNIVWRHFNVYTGEMHRKATENLTNDVLERLAQLQAEVKDAMKLSSYNKRKSPVAVFNHLISIVEKYLSFIPEQSFLYLTLVQFRQNEVLQCLLNISIYLGTIETSTLLSTEVKNIFSNQSNSTRQQHMTEFHELIRTRPNISGVDARQLQALIGHQQSVLATWQNSVSADSLPIPIGSTSFSTSLMSSSSNRSRLSVNLKDFCSYLFESLLNHEVPLTVKQFVHIENRLCTKYNVGSFADFKFDEEASDDGEDVNLISFLHNNRRLVDPNEELSVYGHNVPFTDRRELYELVNQVIESNSGRQNMSEQAISMENESTNEDVQISADNLQILESVVTRKFGGLLGFRKMTDALRKSKQLYTKEVCSIVRFEESVLDFNHLDRIGRCPTMSITNEDQLCQFLLQCPVMMNLYSWSKWSYFFESTYGKLKAFVKKKAYVLRNMLLLETSDHELLHLPAEATLKSFESELEQLHVRSAVGFLCTLITCEYGLTTLIPLNIYRTSMRTWFIRLQSLAMTNHQEDPMRYILEFLTYLPVLIGQARLIQEIILGPLDDVFPQVGVNVVSARTRIWKLANEQQRDKLEIWGYMLDINSWKNESKWLGRTSSSEEQILHLGTTSNTFTVQNDVHTVIPTPSTQATETEILQSKSAPIEVKPSNKDQSVQPACEHIESIRRGFGVGSSLDSNSQSIVNNLQGKVERSLQKLSEDLYSEQGHFVLELIQNADDNAYPPDCLPTLRFVLSDQRILVCNNEIGFQPKNVDAICDIGASTKGKHKE
ncbi:unnamed protein product, partial [Adineta ricciae]